VYNVHGHICIVYFAYDFLLIKAKANSPGPQSTGVWLIALVAIGFKMGALLYVLKPIKIIPF